MFRHFSRVFVAIFLVLLGDAPIVEARAEEPISGIVFPIMAPQVSSGFGLRKHPIRRVIRHHRGVDLVAPTGTHIRAVTGGQVIFADSYAGYGKLVTILHARGYTSHYGHLDELSVNPGDRVVPGQIIGRLGNSGESTGPHLHFEWRQGGQVLDPLRIFPELAAEADG